MSSLLCVGPGEGRTDRRYVRTASVGGTPDLRDRKAAIYSMRIFDSEESGISVPKRTGKNIVYL